MAENHRQLDAMKFSEPPTPDVVLRRLRDGSADLLYLAAVGRAFPSVAAQALQQLENDRRRMERKFWATDPAEIRRVTEREGNGE